MSELRTDADIDALFSWMDQVDSSEASACEAQWEQDIREDPAGARAWTAFVDSCKRDLDRIDAELHGLLNVPECLPSPCEFSIKTRRMYELDGRLRKFLNGDVPYWIEEGAVDKW